MSFRILSFFIEGVNWRVAQTPGGYFHRGTEGMPEWKSGIPAGIASEVVESTFGQFTDGPPSLEPRNINFKLTFRIGHSDTDCFIFSSPEGDLFSVKIPQATFTALQEAFPTQSLPRMRIARMAVQQALAEGFPEIELLAGGTVYDAVKSQITSSLPQQV